MALRVNALHGLTRAQSPNETASQFARLHGIVPATYGFARVDKGEKLRWGEMMQGYFDNTRELKLVLQLVDIRHEPTQDDIDMVNFLRATGAKFQLIATKADKISRGARMKYTAPIGRALQTQPWELICWSSENGNGRDQLLKVIEQAIKA